MANSIELCGYIAGWDANGKRVYNPVQLITTYVSGTSGYNIWSNGFCQQWGRSGEGWVTFAKTFKDANYNLITCAQGNNADAVYGTNVRADRRQANRFFPYYSSGAIQGSWFASGYLAKGQY